MSLPTTTNRIFLPPNLEVKTWEDVAPFYKELLERKIQSTIELEKWMLDHHELEAVMSENYGWRYIKMSCDTNSEEYLNDHEYFINEIEPKIAPIENQLNQKFVQSPFLPELDSKKYFTHLREVNTSIDLFRKENIPLNSQLTSKVQKYASISGQETIHYNSKEYTIPQSSVFLKNTDRNIRKEIYHLIQKRKDQDENTLNALFEELFQLRSKIATNAGFANYRDYKFKELGRFDYTPNDCLNFHSSIEKHFKPLRKKLDLNRQQKLQYEKYYPWDTEVDTNASPPLSPFKNAEEMIEKSILCFQRIDPFFGDCLQKMKDLNHLDLASRKGKAPGGFNYPLHECGIPFIFMNSVGLQKDLVTIMHEGGHAVHAFLTKDYKINTFKNVPSEAAELASMSMELISMSNWDIFYNNADLRRAKREQLEKIIQTLCWIANVDAFQHKIYTNPIATPEQRYKDWTEVHSRFETGLIDYTGFENIKKRIWHAQLHIFEVPFYYIEYGFAQLGAVAVWRNYLNNAGKALQDYKNALSLGYTKPIPDIYEAANIKFDFSEDYVASLAEFLSQQLESLS